MATKTLMTADEFLLMPADNQRHELIQGEVRSMPPAGGKHGRTGIKVAVPLALAVKEQGLGIVFAAETGFRIARDPDTVRAPDVSFLRAERWAALDRPHAFIEGPPDLAVEVVSPSDSAEEVHEKGCRGWRQACDCSGWCTRVGAQSPCTPRTGRRACWARRTRLMAAMSCPVFACPSKPSSRREGLCTKPRSSFRPVTWQRCASAWRR